MNYSDFGGTKEEQYAIEMTCEFAKWLGENQYTKHQVNDKWFDAINYIGTTKELFERFKSSYILKQPVK